jgi:hypothetical protein
MSSSMVNFIAIIVDGGTPFLPPVTGRAHDESN